MTTPCSRRGDRLPCASRAAARAGFTLVELLITLLLASIVVLVFYAFLTVASNATWTQADALRATERLELAMSTVTSDVRSAGHLGVPNFALDPDDYRGELVICGTVLGGGAGNPPIAVELADSPLAARAFATNAVDLQLVGAFEIQEPLLVTGVSADSLQVRIPPSFAPRGLDPSDLLLWQDAFRTRWARAVEGSALLITNPRGGAVIVEAGATSELPGALLFDATLTGNARLPVPLGSFALVSDAARAAGGTSERAFSDVCRFTDALLTGEGISVSVLNRVRYRRITAREAGLVAESGTTLSDPDEPVLIRETIAFGAPANPPATAILEQVLVARNITDFQVFIDGGTEAERSVNGFAVPQRSPASSASPHAPGQVGNVVGSAARVLAQRDATGASCVHHARHVYVQMSAAFDRAVPGLGAQTQLLRSVVPARWADGTPTQFTRVLTTRAEVSLFNFAFADLRGGGGC